jgi:hypothetical protein
MPTSTTCRPSSKGRPAYRTNSPWREKQNGVGSTTPEQTLPRSRSPDLPFQADHLGTGRSAPGAVRLDRGPHRAASQPTGLHARRIFFVTIIALAPVHNDVLPLPDSLDKVPVA